MIGDSAAAVGVPFVDRLAGRVEVENSVISAEGRSIN